MVIIIIITIIIITVILSVHHNKPFRESSWLEDRLLAAVRPRPTAFRSPACRQMPPKKQPHLRTPPKALWVRRAAPHTYRIMRLLKALKIRDIQLRVMNTRVRKLRKTIKDIKQCADKADNDDNDMATHGDELT